MDKGTNPIVEIVDMANKAKQDAYALAAFADILLTAVEENCVHHCSEEFFKNGRAQIQKFV